MAAAEVEQHRFDVLAGAEGVLLVVGAGAAVDQPVGVADLDGVGDAAIADHAVNSPAPGPRAPA